MLTCGVFCATEDGVDPWSSGCWLVVTNNQLLVDNTEAAVESNSISCESPNPATINQPQPPSKGSPASVFFLFAIDTSNLQFIQINYDLKNRSTSSSCTRGYFRPVPLHILRHTCTKRWPCNESTYKPKKSIDQRNDKGKILSSQVMTLSEHCSWEQVPSRTLFAALFRTNR